MSVGELVASVDVGTSSARAGIFDRSGRLLGRGLVPIATRRPAPDRAEQDSCDIWTAVCAAFRGASREAAVRPGAIAALGFDATCSLVLRDHQGRPLATAPDAPHTWDTILWLDHRARHEATACEEAARAVGHDPGGLSPEMQIPKLLWLKRNHPEAWNRLGAAFDLADFLTWRATGSPARSTCTLACKWGFVPGAEHPWPTAFLSAIGLDDLVDRCALPRHAVPVGERIGKLTETAAAELGLSPVCTVAAGLVDAHSGALALLGSCDPAALAGERALITGTSTSIMGLASRPLRLPGTWGPYRDALLPGTWLIEGGQSASGALLDHLCRIWSAGEPPEALRDRALARIGELIAAEGPDIAPRLHVLPDFHGRRSPRADPEAVGVISGLSLDSSFDGFCRLFWRTCTGLALGLRDILEAQAAGGWPADRLHIAGGHARSPLLLQLYADATGRPIEHSTAPDPVLLGAAMAAAASASLFADLPAACRAMRQPARTIAPDPASRPRMERDYALFLALGRHRREIDALARSTGESGPPEHTGEEPVGSEFAISSGAPAPMLKAQ